MALKNSFDCFDKYKYNGISLEIKEGFIKKVLTFFPV